MKIFSRIKAQLGRKPMEKPVTVVRLGDVDSTNNYLRTYQPAAPLIIRQREGGRGRTGGSLPKE